MCPVVNDGLFPTCPSSGLIHFFHLTYLTPFTSYLVSSLCTEFRLVRYITAAGGFVIFHLNGETNAELMEAKRRGSAVFSAAYGDVLSEFAKEEGKRPLLPSRGQKLDHFPS